MVQQDTNAIIYLKYAVDSSVTNAGHQPRSLIKTGSTTHAAKTENDSVGKLKTYDLLVNEDTAAFSDSSLLRLNAFQEFRFSDIDTIRSQSYEEPVASGPKLFSGHALEPVHKNPQSFNKANPDWFTVILFIILFGFMWVWVFYQKIVRQIINAFFSSSVSNQIVRDENILIQRASVMLSILFYLESALFLYQVSVAFQWSNALLTDGFSRLIIFAFIIAFAYSFKMILLKLLGYLLDFDKPVASYIFNIFLMNNILGIVLLPIVIIIAYVSNPYTHLILIGALLIIGSTYVYRLVRGFFIGMTIPRFSIFYLFLYLCAFEIAPLAIIFKIASG